MMIETMNALIRLGATIYTVDGLDIHSTGHAAKEEQKLMLNLLRPKFFLPVHGELFMRMEHKKTAMKL
jgi:ribonuclease J